MTLAVNRASVYRAKRRIVHTNRVFHVNSMESVPQTVDDTNSGGQLDPLSDDPTPVDIKYRHNGETQCR